MTNATRLVLLLLLTAFATVRADGLPMGWFTYSPKQGEFLSKRDSGSVHSGKAAAAITRVSGSGDNFETVMQAINAAPFAGKRVRLSAWLKTEVADSAQLWLRIDGPAQQLTMDNMDDRPVRGTTGWTRYELILDVPQTATHLAFGALLNGGGSLYVDDFEIGLHTGKEKSTELYSAKDLKADAFRPMKRVSDKPINLDFEQ